MMEVGARRDLCISGMMSGQGGTYHSVRIDGVGKVNGDLDCVEFLCNGTARVKGGLKVQTARLNGMVRVGGSLSAERLQLNGQATIGGDMAGDEMDVEGFLRVNGNCAAESFRSRGGFRVGGLLNAGSVEILLNARSKAREIGGGTIRVQRPGLVNPVGKLIRAILPAYSMLKADTIEGDDIYLENTKAGVVRGTRVTIGPGCKIELVEYQEHFHQEQGAHVTEKRLV